jgi:hypothetical protein
VASDLRRIARALLATAILVSAAVAHAQPSAADRETARAAMDEGDHRFEQKDYAGALASYQAAHAIMGVPTTGVEVAKAQVALGQLVDGRDTALAVARIPVKPGEPEVFAKARAAAAALADSLTARIPSVEVHVAGLASGVDAVIKVDDAELGAATRAAPRKVNPGVHTVSVHAPGYAEDRRQVEVPEGAHLVVDVVMRPDGSPPPAAQPAAAPGPPQEPPPVVPPASGHAPVLAYTALGVGAVGLGVGAVTGVLSLARASDAKSHCSGNSCQPSAQSDIDASRNYAWVSDVGFGVGLVGAALGTWLLLTHHDESAPAGAGVETVGAAPVPGGGLAGVGGRF